MSDRMLKRVWPHSQHPKSILGRGKASICLHYLLSSSLYMVVSCHFSSGLEQSGKTKENLILLSPLVLSFAGPPFFLHLTVLMGHDEDAAFISFASPVSTLCSYSVVLPVVFIFGDCILKSM